MLLFAGALVLLLAERERGRGSPCACRSHTTLKRRDGDLLLRPSAQATVYVIHRFRVSLTGSLLHEERGRRGGRRGEGEEGKIEQEERTANSICVMRREESAHHRKRERRMRDSTTRSSCHTSHIRTFAGCNRENEREKKTILAFLYSFKEHLL